jgi:hypothetical protein
MQLNSKLQIPNSKELTKKENKELLFFLNDGVKYSK